MAEECTADSSIATSSTAPSWWDYNSSSLYSWNTSPCHTQNPSSNSSCEEDVSISTSFTNFSNRCGLTGESSPRIIDHLAASYEFIGEHTTDSNRWTNVLMLESCSQDVKENYLDILSSRSSLSSSAARMFEEPARACDNLKKMDTTNTWELTNSAASSSNFDKQFNVGFVDNIDINEGDRLSNKLSSFVSNGTFDPQAPQPCLRSLGSSSVDHCLQTDLSRMKQMFNDLNGISGLSNSCYGHDMNLNINGQHHDETETRTGDLLRRSISSANNIDGGLNSKYYHNGLSESSCTNGRNFDDSVMFFGSNLIKPSLKSLILPDSKKQRPHFTSSLKQAPKVKLGERITALQQIVSPFGKTDTASVLLEAIGYIKFLQEQVQLISNPYMNDTCTKDPWGNLDMKDRGDMKLDLKSRGLCLVPISCTPQVCRENTGSDYWIPTYRGCLYR